MINVLTIGLVAYAEAAALRSEMVLYLRIGALLWGSLSLLFQKVANAVSVERWGAMIEYSFMAPVHRFTYLAGTVGYAVTCGLVRTHVALVAVGLFAHLHTPERGPMGHRPRHGRPRACRSSASA